MSEPKVGRRRAPLPVALRLSWLVNALWLGSALGMSGPRSAPLGVALAWVAVNLAGTYMRRRTIQGPSFTNAPQADANASKGTSLARDALRRFRRNQLATLSLGTLLLMIAICFSQEWIYARWGSSGDPESFVSLHFDHIRLNKAETFAPPSARHWFGADHLGRDLFARTLFGGRISFLVALVATSVSLAVGVTWGAVAGFHGGRLDHYLMRFVDVLYGLPFMFLVILILTLVNGLHATASKSRDDVDRLVQLERAGQTAEARQFAQAKEITRQTRMAVFLADRVKPLYAMFFALGLVSWLTIARITRGQVLSLRERDFVMAARAVGAGNGRIILRHIVPNLLGPVIVYSTLTIPGVMLSEAFLSFLGLGVSEPECSWGSLAADGIRGVNMIKPYWWLIVYPASALSLTLFSLNFVGDGLRDALDPRSKRP